jgi:hypothetical protein
VPELEPLRGLRVVAAPGAIDGARWIGEVTLLRLAPDEVVAIDATGVVLDDPDALVEPEASLVGAILTPGEFRRMADHVDWPLPTETGVLAQGKVAGVPAKVVGGTPALLFTHAAYADELRDRLGW